MWFILRVYTFPRSPVVDETGFFLGDRGSDVRHLGRLDDVLTVSALNLYGRYVMTMVCAVLDHHKSVRLVLLRIWRLW
ncbi:hypothetical protein ACFXTH_041843 [Malus domestica]